MINLHIEKVLLLFLAIIVLLRNKEVFESRTVAFLVIKGCSNTQRQAAPTAA